MGTSLSYLPCDGCGLPASPDHIADRLRRLELSTRFRPVHMGVLFIALMPPIRPQDDFYATSDKIDFFDPFLTALEIPQRRTRQDFWNFSIEDISWRLFQNVLCVEGKKRPRP